MFDGDDLLFADQTNGLNANHAGLYNDAVQEHYDHTDDNDSALKFDINDASLPVPAESDDCFNSDEPNQSTNHINSVAQQRDGDWIGYENESYRAPSSEVNERIEAGQFSIGHSDSDSHFREMNEETYVKCSYDYNRLPYGQSTGGPSDDLYLQANDIVYNVRRSTAASNGVVASFADRSRPEPEVRECDLLYDYSTAGSAFESEYDSVAESYAGVTYASQPPMIPLVDGFYSADEEDGIDVYDANGCLYAASAGLLDGHCSTTVDQQLQGEEPSRVLLYDASNMSVEMASALRQTGRKGPTTKNCEYCGLFLQHPSKIAAHMRTHTGERPFTCEYCGQDFSQRTPYRMHVKRHIGDLPFVCSICRKKFPSNASRNGHEIRVHHKLQRQGAPRPHLKPTAARQRDAAVAAAAAMEPRPAIVNWSEQSYSALRKPVSDSDLRRINGVVDAVASGMPSSHHGGGRRVALLGERRFAEDRHPPTVAQCTECGLIFKHPSKIQAHMRTHTGEKPFVCKECGLGCSTNSALRVHIRRFHTGERPHTCTWECGRRFVSVAARNEHERIVHAGIKRYQCTVGNCRRLFTRRSYMVKHLQSHAAESSAIAAAHCNGDETAAYLRLTVAAPLKSVNDERSALDHRQMKMDNDEEETEAFYGEPDALIYDSVPTSSSVYDGSYDRWAPPTIGIDNGFAAEEPASGFFLDDFYGDRAAELDDNDDHPYAVRTKHPILYDEDSGARELTADC